jgi:hypothetical protein
VLGSLVRHGAVNATRLISRGILLRGAVSNRGFLLIC